MLTASELIIVITAIVVAIGALILMFNMMIPKHRQRMKIHLLHERGLFEFIPVQYIGEENEFMFAYNVMTEQVFSLCYKHEGWNTYLFMKPLMYKDIDNVFRFVYYRAGAFFYKDNEDNPINLPLHQFLSK